MFHHYTLMTRAWDLDKDTHSHFRRYLDVFINKRKISKDLTEFVEVARIRATTTQPPSLPSRPPPPPAGIFNELRINLPNRIFRILLLPEEEGWVYTGWHEQLSIEGSLDRTILQGGRIKHMQPGAAWPQMLAPCNQYRSSSLIEIIHPPKYYHEGVKKSDVVKGA